MARFTSDLLDLSRLLPPEAIRDVNYETVMSERRALLAQYFAEAGIEYDVTDLESGLANILQGVDGEREVAAVMMINDAVRSVLLAFASGNTLEHLGALFGVKRMDGELDGALRERIQTAPDAYGAAGSEGAYIHWARSADVRVKSVAALGPSAGGLRPGQVRVVIAAEPEHADEVLDIVSRRLFAPDVKPLTDMLSVTLATPIWFDVKATLLIPRGPDPNAVRIAARSGLDAYLAKRRKIGLTVAKTGLASGLHVSAADNLLIHAPTEDVIPGPTGIAVLRDVDIQTQVIGN